MSSVTDAPVFTFSIRNPLSTYSIASLNVSCIDLIPIVIEVRKDLCDLPRISTKGFSLNLDQASCSAISIAALAAGVVFNLRDIDLQISL